MVRISGRLALASGLLTAISCMHVATAADGPTPFGRCLSDYANEDGSIPDARDNATDDTSALREALGEGPGVVYVGPGFYRWGDVSIPPGVAVVGAGRATVVRSNGADQIFAQRDVSDWAVRDMVLDGEAEGDWHEREDAGHNGILTDGCWGFEIVGVATHLQTRDQSNVIERSLGRRVTLAWPASASDDVAGYRVYHDDRSGTVDYETVVDEVDANPGGLARDDYAWTSDELAAGTWRFGIRAADAAGNVKTAPVREVELTLTPPPDPPADLAHDYHDVTHTVTLSWSAPERWT